jgi:hypothetical protein
MYEDEKCPLKIDTFSEREALAIYQEHLDVLTNAMMENNFEPFFERISLPHHIQNINAEFVSTNRAQMHALFQSMHERTKADAITTVVRVAKKACFVSSDEIVGEHTSEMLRGATRALQPFNNRLRLIRTKNGIWQETNSANAVKVKAGQMGLPVQTIADEEIPEFGHRPENDP